MLSCKDINVSSDISSKADGEITATFNDSKVASSRYLH